MFPIFILYYSLWSVAALNISLRLAGDRRERANYLIRVAAGLPLVFYGALLSAGVLSMNANDFPMFVLLMTAIEWAHFFVSDFAVYIIERTPKGLKNVVIHSVVGVIFTAFAFYMIQRSTGLL